MKNVRFIARWKGKAEQLKFKAYILYLAYKDPRVPWYAKVFGACIIGYAFSPIDLIPDFIPILGYLDDIVLIPLGIALALKMIPETVLKECEKKALATLSQGRPKSLVAAATIVTIWLLLIALLSVLVLQAVSTA